MPEPGKKNGARRARSKARETAETNGGPSDPPDPDSGVVVLADTTEQPPVVEESDIPEKVVAEPHYPDVENQQENGTARDHINGGGIERLFHDQEFMDQVIARMVGDYKTMDSLAGEFAEKLRNVLEDNQEFRQRLLKAAVSTETFKGKLIRSLVQDID